MKKSYKVFILIGVLGLLVLVYRIGYDLMEQKAREHLPHVLQEFNEIPPPPHTKRIELNKDAVPESASVTGEYYSKLSYNELKKYYKEKLQSNDWEFLSEVKNGKDFSGRTMYFRKNEYCGRVGFDSVEEKSYSYYGFSVTWELISPCDAFD
ncbi:MAG: hypothetical protein H0Z33_15460 [Bacillaceae bacterium]|nr:hypothetical protein [Bacillaceae bacterium]